MHGTPQTSDLETTDTYTVHIGEGFVWRRVSVVRDVTSVNDRQTQSQEKITPPLMDTRPREALYQCVSDH